MGYPMVKSCLKTAVIISVLSISSISAQAAMTVNDPALIAKAAEQFNKMQEQLQKLNEMKRTLNDQIEAIGKLGKITLPIINIAKLGNQLKKDMQCLMPNFKELIPELKLEEHHFSICDKSRFYRDNLWIDPIKVGGESVFGNPTTGEGGWSDPDQTSAHDYRLWEAARNRVKKVRQAIIQDAVSNGLAQGDKGLENSKDNSEAIDDLQSSVDAAETEQQRLATIAQGQVVMARISNQRNQLLSQLLKVSSAFVMEAGIPLENYSMPASEGNDQ